MSRHIDCLTALGILIPYLGAVIVGKRWPPPRWFLGSGGPPPGTSFVIVGTDFVVVGTDSVIVPSP